LIGIRSLVEPANRDYFSSHIIFFILRDRNDFLFNFSFIEYGVSLLERTMMDDIGRKKLKIHGECTSDNSTYSASEFIMILKIKGQTKPSLRTFTFLVVVRKGTTSLG
jgi:hypothetical protein